MLGSIIKTPQRGPFLTPSGSFKTDLIERVCIPKGLPNPNSYMFSRPEYNRSMCTKEHCIVSRYSFFVGHVLPGTCSRR